MFRPTPHITAVVLALAAAAPAAQAAVPDHLTVTTSPHPAHVGQTVTARAVARDASGAVVSTYAGAARFTDTAHAVPAVSTTFAGGVASATFRYTAPIHAEAVAVTAGALSVTSARFDLLGPVTTLTVSVPLRGDAASPFTAVVTARDAAGSRVTDYHAQPSWTDRAGAFAGTQPSAFASGVSRTTLSGTAPLRADVLTVRTPDATADSRSFTRVGGLDHVDLSVPASVEQSTYFPVVARARDAAGNLVTSFSGQPSWDDSPSGLDPAIPNEFVDGVSTTYVRVGYPIHHDVIVFRVGGLETFSRGFDVLGAPDHLDISGTPAEATVGTAFTVVSTLRDAANNVLANVNGDQGGTWNYDGQTRTLGAFTRGVSRTTVTPSQPRTPEQLHVAILNLTAASPAFATVGPFDSYAITWTKSPTAAGCAGTLVIRALDAVKNIVKTYQGDTPPLVEHDGTWLSRHTTEPFRDGVSTTEVSSVGRPADTHFYAAFTQYPGFYYLTIC